MKMSRTIAYGISATMQLALHEEIDKPIPCSKLAEIGQMPERFLNHILRELVYAGVLKSVQGVAGGYCLARPANQITLLQIVEAFENCMETHFPMIPGTPMAIQTQILERLHSAATAARDEMRKLTVADLVSISLGDRYAKQTLSGN
jgi:Rrf2 family protein